MCVTQNTKVRKRENVFAERQTSCIVGDNDTQWKPFSYDQDFLNTAPLPAKEARFLVSAPSERSYLK